MGKEWRKPKGVTIRAHKAGTETINITFRYQGERCREPLDLPLNQKNLDYAGRLLGEIKNDIERGTFRYADYFPNSPKLTKFGVAFSDADMAHYLDLYIENAQSRGCKPSSLMTYFSRVDFLREHVGNKLPSDITPGLVRDLVKQWSQTHSGSGIGHYIKVLKAALKEAVVDGVIQTNPLEQFRLSDYISSKHQPPVATAKKQPQEDIDPFLPGEVRALLNATDDTQEQSILRFGFGTGLRIGELCALDWANVDLNQKRAKIVDNFVSGVGLFGTPKTASSIRFVKLDDEPISALHGMMEMKWNGGLVFRNPRAQTNEGNWNSKSLRLMFQRLCKASGVRYRYPYQMRHTFATRHISEGANLWWLAEQMGHKSPQMLYDHYGQFIEEYAHEHHKQTLASHQK